MFVLALLSCSNGPAVSVLFLGALLKHLAQRNLKEKGFFFFFDSQFQSIVHRWRESWQQDLVSLLSQSRAENKELMCSF